MLREPASEATVASFLPWQQAQAQAWLQQRERFAHAWLIHGLAGIGKRQFAWAAAASLLCEAPQLGLACGHCPACRWLQQGNHPDFRAIRPDAVAVAEGADEITEVTEAGGKAKAPSREIRIEQIREIERWLSTATHRGGSRVVLLYPVQAMNLFAANALLKMLEEPPAHTLFLLVTDAPDRVLPTILSRTRRLPLAMPAPEQALAWLQAQGVSDAPGFLAAAGGAPVAALALSQRQAQAWPEWLPDWLQAVARGQGHGAAARLAGDFDKSGALVWLEPLQRVVCDLQLVQAGLAARYYPGLQNPYAALQGRCGRVALAQFGRYLAQQVPLANHPLNGRLFAQAAFLRFLDALNPAA